MAELASSGDTPFLVKNGTFQSSQHSSALLERVGGQEAIFSLTNSFYERAFKDSHFPQFVRDQGEAHGHRLGLWIIQKMSGANVWSLSLETREEISHKLGNGQMHAVRDRSSAHVAAWYSTKRQPENIGKRFKLEDCRVWLRMFFWAARDVGLLNDAQFSDWLTRFLGHFIAVYERTATLFVRDSLRWSDDKEAVQNYLDNGRVMEDVFNLRFSEALLQLPENERNSQFPYND